jgi:hypothetical protein
VIFIRVHEGVRSRVVAKTLGYKPEGRRFETKLSEFFNLRNPSGRNSPGIHSASKRNEYHKHKEIVLYCSILLH